MITALIVAVSVLCGLRQTHRAHAVHASQHPPTMPHSHGRNSSRAGRSGNSVITSDHVDSGVHRDFSAGAGPQTLAMLPSTSAMMFAERTIALPMADENVLALGSAPRAPGAPRGPPTLS
ncbi:MAG TPA: hypothetical protein VM865_05675 [Acidobacteriaceae bacterium]|nr:hypothetical protein [Acidobacteriaceae bacterium]